MRKGVKDDGNIAAWGDNDKGQINVPAGLTNIRSIVTSGEHSIALHLFTF